MSGNYLFDRLLGDQRDSERLFAVCGDGTRWSYQQLFDETTQLAQALISLGLKPGDRVTVQASKSLSSLALYLAVVRVGGVYQPLNTAYTTTELKYFLTDATPRLLVVDADRVSASEAVASPLSIQTVTLDADHRATLRHGAQHRSVVDVPRTENDLAAILYTSGTTGRSKGAMLTHGNLFSNADTLRVFWQFSETDRLIHALPIFHTHGLFVATNVTLLAGCSLFFLERFSTDAVIEAFAQSTCLMGVPTFYTRLLSDPRLTADAVANMRLFVSGSAPLLAETHSQFSARTGHAILERYGMTETNMNASNPFDGERRPGTVGQALPGIDVAVCDPETGMPLPQGSVGSIEVRGPNVFTGYWNMPDKTAEEFRSTGAFISGDLGMYDADGYLTIVGRDKDMIISGGFNIYPKEIEVEIDGLPGVAESAVIGVPHADFGEGVVAIIVGSASGPATTDAILESLDGKLARFKLPKHIAFVDELPRNTMGKVQKNILREQFQDCLVR